jgi:hypothetical protein
MTTPTSDESSTGSVSKGSNRNACSSRANAGDRERRRCCRVCPTLQEADLEGSATVAGATVLTNSLSLLTAGLERFR